jgi:hypothetical protein
VEAGQPHERGHLLYGSAEERQPLCDAAPIRIRQGGGQQRDPLQSACCSGRHQRPRCDLWVLAGP